MHHTLVPRDRAVRQPSRWIAPVSLAAINRFAIHCVAKDGTRTLTEMVSSNWSGGTSSQVALLNSTRISPLSRPIASSVTFMRASSETAPVVRPVAASRRAVIDAGSSVI